MPETIGEMQKRAFMVTGTSSFNEEDRTFEVVFATGTQVKRYSYDEGYYMEELVVDKKAVRTNRFKAMSFLDTHDHYSMDMRLGTVVPGSVRIEGGKGIATIKLSRKQRAEELLQDLRDGHPLPVSVGYKIHKFEKSEGVNGGLPIIRAIDWEPMEISAAPIPADADAVSRSEEHAMNNRVRRVTGSLIEDPSESPALLEQRRVIEEAASRKMSLREARGFAAELASQHGWGRFSDDVQQRLRSGITEMEVRSAFLELAVEEQNASPSFPHVETRGMGGRDEHFEQHVRARQDALVARMTGGVPEGDGRHFMTHSLFDHARGLIEAQGVDTRNMSREEVFGYRSRGMHTTSDFPLLLTGAGERVLLGAYASTQSPLKTVISRETSLPDFRAASRLRISGAGTLQKVNEHGEVKFTTRGEVEQGSYKLNTYANAFAITREALINDDLNAFGDWSSMAGKSASDTESQLFLDLLLESSGAGPVMKETNKRLFHADHGNLAASGAALSVASLSAARLAMRTQNGIGNKVGTAAGASQKTFLRVPPKYLLVGPKMETEAEKVLAAINATTVDDVNPFSGRLQLVVEDGITDFSWYLFADKGAVPTLEHAYLLGNSGPQVVTQEGFYIMGLEIRVSLDFGVGAIDYRGAYRNPGAAPT